jgi:DNA glycosylase AlkZ-like
MLEVTRRLCGLHAQVMSCAELTAWARVENLPKGAVRKALWQDKSLVKTWAMRGTLHLLPSDELPLWHALLAASPRYLSPARWKRIFDITLEELDAITEAVGASLHGKVLTREELVKEVARRTGSKAMTHEFALNSWGLIFRPAAFSGHLCFAESVGARVRFTHPRSWLGGLPRKIEAGAAAAEVTRRFLAVYGPATAWDLARWSGGGGVTTARRWLAALRDEVSEADVEGTRAFVLTEDLRELRSAAPARSVRLLPGFDQYVVNASGHAEHLMPRGLRARIYRPQGWISPVLLVNGLMEGTWRHALEGSRVAVTIEPFASITASVRKAAEREAERLADFLGGALELTWARKRR